MGYFCSNTYRYLWGREIQKKKERGEQETKSGTVYHKEASVSRCYVVWYTVSFQDSAWAAAFLRLRIQVPEVPVLIFDLRKTTFLLRDWGEERMCSKFPQITVMIVSAVEPLGLAAFGDGEALLDPDSAALLYECPDFAYFFFWTGSGNPPELDWVRCQTHLSFSLCWIHQEILPWSFIGLTQLIILFCAWLHRLSSSGTLVGHVGLLSSLGSLHRWKPLDLYQDKLRGKYWSLVKCQGRLSSLPSRNFFIPKKLFSLSLCKGNTNTHTTGTM